MESASGEPLYMRLRSIREAHGVTQLEFLELLNLEANVRSARPYSQSTLSKLESGSQTASFLDVAIFAAIDPLNRGKLWLAWGETTDPTLVANKARTGRPHLRDIPIDAMHPVATRKPAPRKRASDR